MNGQPGKRDEAWQEPDEFLCITCSDQALPARVMSVQRDSALAQVEIEGSRQEIDISLVDAVMPGDVLLVHGGVALEKR